MTSARSDSPRPPPRPDRLHDLVGRGDADVRGDERLFERLDRFDVDRLAAPRRLVRPLDDLVEPFDELLFRARQRLLDLVEEAHSVLIVSFSIGLLKFVVRRSVLFDDSTISIV